jgi:Cof subfamily protein (haloacid dehalogenase superfamily)
MHKGIKIILATGRLHFMTNATACAIGVTTPIIACNGAYICDENKVYKSDFLQKKYLQTAMQIIKEWNPEYFVYTDKTIAMLEDFKNSPHIWYWQKENADTHKFIRHYKNTDELVHAVKDNALKILILEEDAVLLQQMKQKMLRAGLSVVQPDTDSLEVIPADTDKGVALEFLARLYQIPMGNTMAIGNSENDIGLLKSAGISVAMGNSFEHVKGYADFVTADNEHDGVALAIEKFAL